MYLAFFFNVIGHSFGGFASGGSRHLSGHSQDSKLCDRSLVLMRAVCLTCVCLLMCPVIGVVLVPEYAGWDCILHYSWSYFLVDTSVSRVQQGVVTCLNLQQICNSSSFSSPGSFKGEIRMTWYKLRIIQDGEITIGQNQKHLEKDLCLGVSSVQNTSWLLCMLLLHNALYILL